MFIVKINDHDGNHRCVVEKKVPIAFIMPSRWQDGAESSGMETTSCNEIILEQKSEVLQQPIWPLYITSPHFQ